MNESVVELSWQSNVESNTIDLCVYGESWISQSALTLGVGRRIWANVKLGQIES